MAISVRTRFEVFKRDDFTCGYCGRRSPTVVLEVDHIVPVFEGGADDPINLRTSCWDCNRGKAHVPLSEVVTGEDPHDRAVMLLERRRQLEEYNQVLAAESESRERDAWMVWRYFQQERGYTSADDLDSMPKRDRTWLMNTLTYCPRVKLLEFIDQAIAADATRDLRYVKACVRNWRETTSPPTPSSEELALTEQAIDAEISYARSTALDEAFEAVSSAEVHRRHIGRCPHDPPCAGYMPCVVREARLRLTRT